MKKSAILSEDRKYRYELSRIWNESLLILTFVALNPSSYADENTDSKTINRMINIAKSDGYGGIYIVNLYAFRTTYPNVLKSVDNPIGNDNISHVKRVIALSDKVVYCWGNKEKEPVWLRNLVLTPYCLGLSKKGIPLHPISSKCELRPVLYKR